MKKKLNVQIDEWTNNESAFQSTGDSKKYGREEEEEAWMNFTVKLSWQKLGNNIITRFKFLVGKLLRKQANFVVIKSCFFLMYSTVQFNMFIDFTSNFTKLLFIPQNFKLPIKQVYPMLF